MSERAEQRDLLAKLQTLVSPEVYARVSSQLGDLSRANAADNQNQNQGGMEELAKLKPDILREITIGSPAESTADDNQNQNQGKLEDLLRLKPEVLRQVRVGLRRGDEVMDNQNQNQGTQAGVAAEKSKPPLSAP